MKNFIKRNLNYNLSIPQVRVESNVRGFLAFTSVGCACGAGYGFYQKDYRLCGLFGLGSILFAGAYVWADYRDKSHELELKDKDIEIARAKHPESIVSEEGNHEEIHPYLIAEKKSPSFYSLNDIANAPGLEVTPLVGDYFYKGDVVVFFGATNCGKTIYAVQMGIDIASGDASVIPMDVKPPVQNVKYISFEMRLDQIKKRFTSENGTTIKFPANFNYMDCAGCFNDVEKFLDFLANLVENQTSVDTVIFIDTITDLCPNFFNKEAAHVINSLRAIQVNAKRIKGITLTFVIEAHAVKTHDWDPLDLATLRGGGNHAALADSVFCLGQAKGSTDRRYMKNLKTRNNRKPEEVDLFEIVHTTHVHPKHIGTAKEEDILPKKPKSTGQQEILIVENTEETVEDVQPSWNEKIPLEVIEKIYPHYKKKKEELGNKYGYGHLMKDFDLDQYINNREELSPIFKKYVDFIGEE